MSPIVQSPEAPESFRRVSVEEEVIVPTRLPSPVGRPPMRSVILRHDFEVIPPVRDASKER